MCTLYAGVHCGRRCVSDKCEVECPNLELTHQAARDVGHGEARAGQALVALVTQSADESRSNMPGQDERSFGRVLTLCTINAFYIQECNNSKSVGRKLHFLTV